MRKKYRFIFWQNSSKETSQSKGYDDLYKQLQYEKDHGKRVYVIGHTFDFDLKEKETMCKLIWLLS